MRVKLGPICWPLLLCLVIPSAFTAAAHTTSLRRHTLVDDDTLATAPPPKSAPKDISNATVYIDGSKAIAKTHSGYINLNIEFFPETFPVLSNPKVRFLISQLAPATLRIGGNSADSTTYALNSTWEQLCEPWGSCFTPDQLHKLMTFANAVNWDVMFNLNEYWTYPDPVIDPDTGPRTARPGPFKNENNKALMQYMADSDLVPATFSLGNELPDNLSPEVTAADYRELYDAMTEIWPDKGRPA